MDPKSSASRRMIALLLAGCAIVPAITAGASADPCSLLSTTDLGKVLAQSFDAPSKSTAPRPFANTAEGADCTYTGSNGSRSQKLLFRIYTDPSPTAAADLFARLGMFYSPQTPVSGLGDKAYFDRNHGLHVLAGSTRFFLALDAVTPATDDQLRGLGSLVVGRL
jgi:hypothetical protein